MQLFLLGILFDEALRRWIIPWIRKDRERGHLLGRLCGATIGPAAFKPASTDGMYYMSGAEKSFTELLKEDAARALVDSFAQELMSGSLGHVDEHCRAALHRHLAHHKRRSAMMGFGFHNPFRRAHKSAPQLPAPPLPGPTPDNPGGDAPPPDDGGAEAAVAGMLGMPIGVLGHRHGHRHHGKHHHRHHSPHAAAMGFGWDSLNPFSSHTSRALISTVPGGAAAVQAHDLVKRGRGGNQAALVRIAQIKHKAGRGDKNAAKALNHIKTAHTAQTGQHHAPSGGGRWRHHYAAGSDLMVLHPHHRVG